MSVIEERNAEILRPQLNLIAQGRSRELDVPPEVGNRDRVSIKTTFKTPGARPEPTPFAEVELSRKFVSE
jgi:hypothetical protein